MYFGSNVPPCPGDPEDYVLVKTKESRFWRKKRGKVKPAKLNKAFQANAEAMSIVAPAAKRVIAALQPYMEGIKTGRLNTRIGNAFRQSLKDGKGLSLGYLKDIELQGEHPWEKTVTALYKLLVKTDSVRIEIPIDRSTVKALSPLVTEYWFDAVVLYGDAGKERGLRTESVESLLYPYKDKRKSVCVLELELPKKGDWCVVLKMSSLEGNEMAIHSRHYRMRVIEGNKG